MDPSELGEFADKDACEGHGDVANSDGTDAVKDVRVESAE